uniref:Uncharacterized protein n=1 Tax=Magallana gigas TaxID=29159 RepID=K1PJW6_MAGGI
MSNAFSPPRSLKVMYVFGWAVPLLSSTLYGILRGILNNESRSLSTSKRLNQTDQQTLSIRSEYDVGKNGDQCYKSLIVPTEGKDEMELKEKSTNGSLLHNGPHGET